MAKTINGIKFNDLSTIEGQSSKFEKISFPGISSESDLQDYIDAGEEYKNIPSVLINWNGAEWPSSTATEPRTINTTGDLINAIKYASQVGGGGRNKI